MNVRWQNPASSSLLQTAAGTRRPRWHQGEGSEGVWAGAAPPAPALGVLVQMEQRIRLYCWVDLCMCECALKGQQRKPTTVEKDVLGGKPALQCCVAQCCSAFHFQRMEKCCPPGLRSRLGSPLLWACDSTQLQLQFPHLMCRGRLSPAMTALFLHMTPLITKERAPEAQALGNWRNPPSGRQKTSLAANGWWNWTQQKARSKARWDKG